MVIASTGARHRWSGHGRRGRDRHHDTARARERHEVIAMIASRAALFRALDASSAAQPSTRQGTRPGGKGQAQHVGGRRARHDRVATSAVRRSATGP